MLSSSAATEEDEGERDAVLPHDHDSLQPLTPRHGAAGTPAAAAAKPTVSPGPKLIPTVIHLSNSGPVVAAAGSLAVLTAAPRQITRPVAVATPNVYDLTGPQHQQATGAAPPAPIMSALTAVQKVRRIVERSQERAKKVTEEQEHECVICLDRPMNTVLRPCGHVQMCLECCHEHMAIAESRGVKPQVILCRYRLFVPILSQSQRLCHTQCPTCRMPIEDALWLESDAA